jgi:hypothetical protein
MLFECYFVSDYSFAPPVCVVTHLITFSCSFSSGRDCFACLFSGECACAFVFLAVENSRRYCFTPVAVHTPHVLAEDGMKSGVIPVAAAAAAHVESVDV